MMQQWHEAWRLIRQQGWTLLSLVLLLCLPLLGLNALAVLGFGISPDDADKGIGLINALLMPVVNGGVVWLVHRGSLGERPSVAAALRAVPGYWSRLFVAYVGVSLILAGWLVLTVLPAYIVMAMLKIEQPYVLIPFGLLGLGLALPRFVWIDPLVVIEGLSPFYARQRSAALVKSRRWQVIGYGLVVYSVPLALELAGEFLPGLLGLDERTAGLGFGLGLGLVSAVVYVVPTVFFYSYYRKVVGDELG